MTKAIGGKSRSGVKSIDVHAHIFLKDAIDTVRKKYPKYVPTITPAKDGTYVVTSWNGEGKSVEPESAVDLNIRLAEMDRCDVGMQALSTMPSVLGRLPFDRFFYDIEAAAGLDFCRALNDGMAGVVGKYPDRFVGLATVPLQDIGASVDELGRAVRELGLRGVEIGSHVEGMNLDDKSLWPFYGMVEKLGVPIMVHPAEPPGRDRLSNYQLVNFIGFPLETTIAGMSMIFGGVLKDFPRLKVYFVHGGGFLPYQRGRFEHGYMVREDPKRRIDKPPSEYFKLIYFDALTHDQHAMEYLISSVGANRVMLGTDYPADMTDSNLVGKIQGLKTISEDDKEHILWGNAAELFKIN